MKKIIFLLWISSLSLNAQIQRVSSIKTLFDTAKMLHKDVFIKVYSPDCHYCKNLEKALSKDTVSKFYNQNFVNYYLNFKDIADSEREFLKEKNLNVSGVPLLLFFNSNGEIIYQDVPQGSIKEVLESAKDAKNPKYHYANVERNYLMGSKSIKVLFSMSSWAKLLKKDSLLDTIAQDLFYTFQKKDSLATKKSFLVLKKCVYDIDNGLYQYWAKNSDSIFLSTLNISPKEHKEVLLAVLNHTLDFNKKRSYNLEKIKRVKEAIKNSGMSDKPDNFFWEDELTLLIKEDKKDDYFNLVEKLLTENKFEPISCNYYIVKCLSVFPKGNPLKKINKWIDELEKNAQTDNDKKVISNLRNTYNYYDKKE